MHKYEKGDYRMKYIFLMVICTLIFGGCTTKENDIKEEIESGTSYAYIKDASFKTNWDGYQVQGKIQFFEPKKAYIGNAFALCNTELTVSGTLQCEGGSLQIIYCSEDGEELSITESDGGDIEATIDIPKGKGKIYFEGEDLVCQYTLNISIPWGISYSGF